MTRNVVCLWTGDKYGWEYVRKLHDAVTRHTTVNWRFVVITDRSMRECQIISEHFPDMYIHWYHTDLPIWWGKLHIFDEDWPHKGRNLYIDLDTIIMNNIDDMFDSPWKIIRWERSQIKHGGRWYASGMFSLETGYQTQVWDDFDESVMDGKMTDQKWILENADEADGFTDKEVGSYKWDILTNNRNPNDFKVIAFHGSPKPHEVDDLFVEENW